MKRACLFATGVFLFLIASFIYDSHSDIEKVYGESINNGSEPLDAIINVQNCSYISSSTPIMITFNELIDTGSLKLSGTMITQVAVIEWLNINDKDTILIINPQYAWPTGFDLTLRIECSNRKADQVYNLNLTYNVVDKSCCGGKNRVCEVNL